MSMYILPWFECIWIGWSKAVIDFLTTCQCCRWEVVILVKNYTKLALWCSKYFSEGILNIMCKDLIVTSSDLWITPLHCSSKSYLEYCTLYFFRFIQFGGMTGILAGMMVAFKQIKSEQELIGSLGLRIKVGLMEQSEGCTLYFSSTGPFSCLFIFHWVKIPWLTKKEIWPKSSTIQFSPKRKSKYFLSIYFEGCTVRCHMWFYHMWYLSISCALKWVLKSK